MDAAQRLELIRARLSRPKVASFQAPGAHRVANPDMPAWPKRQRSTCLMDRAGPVPVHKFMACYARSDELVAKWVGEPDAVPRVTCAPKKRRKGRHYLSEIAEKVLVKLPKLADKLQ